MKLSQDEMIKVYACLSVCFEDLYKGLDSRLLSLKDLLVPDRDDDNQVLYNLMMKFYCEIDDQNILDKIDDIVEGKILE